MKITSVRFTESCRECLQEFDFTIYNPEDIELETHEHLESEGWGNGYCPQCYISKYDRNLPDNQDYDTDT